MTPADMISPHAHTESKTAPPDDALHQPQTCRRGYHPSQAG